MMLNDWKFLDQSARQLLQKDIVHPSHLVVPWCGDDSFRESAEVGIVVLYVGENLLHTL